MLRKSCENSNKLVSKMIDQEQMKLLNISKDIRQPLQEQQSRLIINSNKLIILDMSVQSCWKTRLVVHNQIYGLQVASFIKCLLAKPLSLILLSIWFSRRSDCANLINQMLIIYFIIILNLQKIPHEALNLIDNLLVRDPSQRLGGGMKGKCLYNNN